MSVNHSKTAMYLIGVENNEQSQLWNAPLSERESDYLIGKVLPTMVPLSDEAYMLGPAVILGTLARYSYVLWEDAVYWCIEWNPGLVVVRFSCDGGMAWTGIRSPVPDFGGRTPLQEDLDAFDDAAENPQYNLVFTAWDAATGDEGDREYFGFLPADPMTQQLFGQAMEHVDSLGDAITAQYGSNREQWSKNCFANIKDSFGDGFRV